MGKFLNMRHYCKASCGIYLLMFMKMVGVCMAVCVCLCVLVGRFGFVGTYLQTCLTILMHLGTLDKLNKDIIKTNAEISFVVENHNILLVPF
jgi:hypothetical protein